MSINLWAVLGCGIFSMILGFVWYGPLFGKKWMEVIGADALDAAERKKMQQRAGPLYAVQLVLALLQSTILGYFISIYNRYVFASAGLDYRGNGLYISVVCALLVWVAFIVPVVATNSMWNNDSSKISWTRFLLSAGYQLVLSVVFAVVFSL